MVLFFAIDCSEMNYLGHKCTLAFGEHVGSEIDVGNVGCGICQVKKKLK
jgi:hypothetical protein